MGDWMRSAHKNFQRQPRHEYEQMEKVAYFGKKFDQYVQRKDWLMLIVLRNWAKKHGMIYCAAQASRASKAILSGDEVRIRTSGMRKESW